MSVDLAAGLGAHAFFRSLSAFHLDAVSRCAAPRSFPAGAVIVREGGVADHFYAITSGDVAIELHVPGRGALVIDTLGPDDVLGVSWLLPPYRWQFDGRALDAVETIEFDGARLRGCLDDDHDLGYEVVTAFAGVVARRLQSARIRLLDVYGDGGSR